MKGLLDTGSGLQKKVVTVNPSWIKTNIGLQKVLKEKYVFNRLVKVFVARWWPQKKKQHKKQKTNKQTTNHFNFFWNCRSPTKIIPSNRIYKLPVPKKWHLPWLTSLGFWKTWMRENYIRRSFSFPQSIRTITLYWEPSPWKFPGTED